MLSANFAVPTTTRARGSRIRCPKMAPERVHCSLMQRRALLKAAGTGVFAGAMSLNFARPALAAVASPVRRLSLLNLHTGDAFADAYSEHGALIPDAVAQITHVMRDFRTNEVHAIDPGLFDLLADLRDDLDTNAPYQIISGYRSPVTNAMLHNASSGVASRSLHMDGKAIDIRVRGVELSRLRDAALTRGRGGVGYYEASNFVHVDTGRVRRW